MEIHSNSPKLYYGFNLLYSIENLEMVWKPEVLDSI